MSEGDYASFLMPEMIKFKRWDIKRQEWVEETEKISKPPKNTKRCPHCGQSFPSHYEFKEGMCQQCFEDHGRCSNCGTLSHNLYLYIGRDDKLFCQRCCYKCEECGISVPPGKVWEFRYGIYCINCFRKFTKPFQRQAGGNWFVANTESGGEKAHGPYGSEKEAIEDFS